MIFCEKGTHRGGNSRKGYLSGSADRLTYGCFVRFGPWVDAYSKGIFTLIGTGRMDFPVRGPVACPVRASREARR